MRSVVLRYLPRDFQQVLRLQFPWNAAFPIGNVLKTICRTDSKNYSVPGVIDQFDEHAKAREQAAIFQFRTGLLIGH